MRFLSSLDTLSFPFRKLISSFVLAAESAPRLPRPVSEVPEEETATRCVSSSLHFRSCALLTDIFLSLYIFSFYLTVR